MWTKSHEIQYKVLVGIFINSIWLQTNKYNYNNITFPQVEVNKQQGDQKQAADAAKAPYKSKYKSAYHTSLNSHRRS